MNSPLADRFGRVHAYLRISLTDRCNFRCVYCMPPEGLDWLPRESTLTADEIVRMGRIFVGLGVRKIRLTGGEPTTRRDVVEISRQLAEIDGLEELCMTTNGFKLPGLAQPLRQAGVHGLNISIDSLRPERFKAIALRDVYSKVSDGIDAAVAAEFPTIKINVVVMAGENEDEVVDFVEFAAAKRVQLRFIEFMPFQGNAWEQARVYPIANMLDRIGAKYAVNPRDAGPNAVATEYRIQSLNLTVGFIGSMTQPFCSTCNRVRLTADGQIKNCLFDRREVDVRQLLREGADDAAIIAKIQDSLSTMWKEHPHMTVLPNFENRPMIAIGG